VVSRDGAHAGAHPRSRELIRSRHARDPRRRCRRRIAVGFPAGAAPTCSRALRITHVDWRARAAQRSSARSSAQRRHRRKLARTSDSRRHALLLLASHRRSPRDRARRRSTSSRSCRTSDHRRRGALRRDVSASRDRDSGPRSARVHISRRVRPLLIYNARGRANLGDAMFTARSPARGWSARRVLSVSAVFRCAATVCRRPRRDAIPERWSPRSQRSGADAGDAGLASRSRIRCGTLSQTECHGRPPWGRLALASLILLFARRFIEGALPRGSAKRLHAHAALERIPPRRPAAGRVPS
jgi:hypothetical protein